MIGAMWLTCRLVAVLFGLATFSSTGFAASASCSFSITAVNFGNIDVTANTTIHATVKIHRARRLSRQCAVGGGLDLSRDIRQ